MSKYIIEIPDDVQYVLLNGQTDNKCYTAVRPVAELEVLNSDYINEHFGELQDEAYRKGYDDGKNSLSKGCEGCRYTSKKSHEEPCFSCTRNHIDQYEPMPKQDDCIEVGDEVNWDGDKCVVTYLNYNFETSEIADYDLLAYDGSVVNHVKKCTFTKTGKHYDIASILEAMRT